MKKNIVKFFVCLTVIMMVAVSNTPYLAQANGFEGKTLVKEIEASGFEEKTLVKEIKITNEEWLEILESQDFDKEVIESYKSILNEENSATAPLFDYKIQNSENTTLTNVTLASVDTSNRIRWYNDGSFELMLNKETLRWIAIIAVAAAVGVLAAIPGVGWTVAAAVTSIILGYAASTISYGRSFAFVPTPTGASPYRLFGVYKIAGW